MSRIFKKHYSNFSRVILAEFLSKKELDEMDKKYTEAKFRRLRRQLETELGKRK